MRRRPRSAASPSPLAPAPSLLLVLLVGAVGGGALVVVLGTGVVDLGWPGAALVTLLPWLLPVALLSALLLGTVRERTLAVAALLVALGAGALVAPRATGGPASCPGGTPLAVAQLNVRRGGADPARVVELVAERGVGLLSLQEVDAEMLDALTSAGLPDLLPEVVAEPTAGVSGGSLHATTPLTPTRAAASDGGSPDVEAEIAGVGPVQVDTTHPVPPVGPARHTAWRAVLDGLPAPTPGVPSLLLGDLNATLDHAALQELLGRGWRDAAAAVGPGLRPTYLGVAAGTPAPPMAIDHVLVGPGVAVVDVWVADVPGSDHRMLGADLLLGC